MISFFILEKLLVASSGLRLAAIQTETSHELVVGIQTSHLEQYVKCLETQFSTWATHKARDGFVIVGGPYDDYKLGLTKNLNPCDELDQDCKEGLLLYRAAQRVRALNATWFISTQEDTYIFMDHLITTLRSFDANKIGVLASFGCGRGWVNHPDSRDGTLPRPQGFVEPDFSCEAVWQKGGICNGMGSVYSRAALEKLVPKGQTQENFLKEYMGNSRTHVLGRSDLTTSCLLHQRGIKVGQNTLYSMDFKASGDGFQDVKRSDLHLVHVSGDKHRVPAVLQAIDEQNKGE